MINGCYGNLRLPLLLVGWVALAGWCNADYQAALTPVPHNFPPSPVAAGVNRSATHLSLLALYAMGGHLVNSGLLPVGVLVTAIGFTFSLVFATQVRGLGRARAAAAAITLAGLQHTSRPMPI